MILKELIIQQYSSYNKDTKECNLHLDGNLNSTLHALTIDVEAFKKVHNFTEHVDLQYVITRPIKVAGLDVMENMIERLCFSLSTEMLTFRIEFLENGGYGYSADENRKKCHDIIATLFVFNDPKFIEEFDAIETHFENTLTNPTLTDIILKWKSGRMHNGGKRFIGTRLNVSKHSADDSRRFLHGYENGIASLVAVSRLVIVQNQQQIDYMLSYCSGVNIKKFHVGTIIDKKLDESYLFSGMLFERQNDYFRIKDQVVLDKIIEFFKTNNRIVYFFPFRLTDPDWGYEKMSAIIKSITIVTNPTNVVQHYSSVQFDFDEMLKDYNQREILSTMLFLLGTQKINLHIPLYSDIFNILHQTTAEIFHICPSSIFFCFDMKGESTKAYEKRVKKLTRW